MFHYYSAVQCHEMIVIVTLLRHVEHVNGCYEYKCQFCKGLMTNTSRLSEDCVKLLTGLKCFCNIVTCLLFLCICFKVQYLKSLNAA